ncbi:DUF1269 domain-containing protein [Chloroflexota bacterium]
MEIPLSAAVQCFDSSCGKVLDIIVDPETRKVTHIVVEDETLARPPYQRLVDIDQVKRTSFDSIHLGCSKEELGHMQPFAHTRSVQKKQKDYTLYEGGEGPAAAGSAIGTPTRQEEEEFVPEGEWVMRHGTPVHATDGRIGQVVELIIDPDDDVITHLVLLESHVFSKKEFTLPVSAVDHAGDGRLYLKLDKQAVERLPSMPARKHHKGEETHLPEMELVARVYDEPGGAAEALEFVEGLHQRQVFKIRNAAVLVREQDGTVSVVDTKDLTPGKGRLIGGIVGGLVGIVGGPVGVVVGALAGIGAGTLGAKWIDKGFSDKFLANLQEHLQPGSSALVLVVEHQWVHSVAESLGGEKGYVFQQELTDELVNELVQGEKAET